jgi:hypothetical protein
MVEFERTYGDRVNLFGAILGRISRPNKLPLVLQCQFGLGCGQMGSSPECLNYLRPEPFFAPLAVPTVDRTIGPKLLFR